MDARARFEELAKLADSEIQGMLTKIDQRHLVTALKGAGKDVKAKFLGGLSKRVRTFVSSEIESGTPSENEIEESQQLIAEMAAKPKKARPKKPGKRYLAMKAKLKETAARPLEELSFDEINRMFRSMAEVARTEGILELQSIAESAGEGLLAGGLRLLVDGTEPELLASILEANARSILHEQQVKLEKVTKGIAALQQGTHPMLLEHQVTVIY